MERCETKLNYKMQTHRNKGNRNPLNGIIDGIYGRTDGRTERQVYECVSKRLRTGRLERELQMVQHSATRCSCIAIL
jgi:hypothetical protein